MTAGLVAPLTVLQQRLARVIAETLRISPNQVLPDEPLSALGMDSLAAVEITAAIEDELGIELSLSAVHEYPTLELLCAFVEGGAASNLGQNRDRMRADAVLPRDIAPNLALAARARLTRDARSILLTGATGFVGAYLLRSLVAETEAVIHCLVRPSRGGARRRLRDQLARYGIWSPEIDERIRIVEGDLSLAYLGLLPSAFVDLSADVDAIYHAAADVNWVANYDALRVANVLGTKEILRFACTGVPKPLHFLSSISVCHSTRAPRAVDEDIDPLGSIDGLWMDYAQTKCVAESLVRVAGDRGLPVTIIRPSLVTGDSGDGSSNPDDLVSRFIAGCVRMRAAPDLDWRMDVVPVDDVATAIVRLSHSHESGTDASHVVAAAPRHWRECVLWMRLAGYDIDLVPYREWMERLAAVSADNPLHALRPFFLRAISAEAGLTLPELFEESRRTKVVSTRTHEALSSLGHSSSALDTRLLSRYFDDYERHQLIARPRNRSRTRGPTESGRPCLDAVVAQVERSLAERFDDESIAIESIALRPVKTDDSIVAELTSWRGGTRAGLYYADVTTTRPRGGPQAVTLFVKSKPVDTDVLDVAEAVAALASPTLREMVARYRDQSGFARSHVREIALYADHDTRLRRNTPAVFATSSDERDQQWLAVLETIDDTSLTQTPATMGTWSESAIDAAIVGLADIHALGIERRDKLVAAHWQTRTRDMRQRMAMLELWSALATHAFAHSTSWSECALQRTHERIVEELSSWACALDDAPTTLIHNDFNPRNIAIRSSGSVPTLCAFDWELATMGLPQRDLAELLAFVLPVNAPRCVIAHWLERHRALLERASGIELNRAQWERGFSAALCDFLVDRLASYAMVDRIRAQSFLPRVVRGWNNLFHHYPWAE